MCLLYSNEWNKLSEYVVLQIEAYMNWIADWENAISNDSDSLYISWQSSTQQERQEREQQKYIVQIETGSKRTGSNWIQ
jgi:hypothetical protein